MWAVLYSCIILVSRKMNDLYGHCYTVTKNAQQSHVSPRMARSVNAFPRMTLEEPWSSASFAPAALIIFRKIMCAMTHGFGWLGCMREKSAS